MLPQILGVGKYELEFKIKYVEMFHYNWATVGNVVVETSSFETRVDSVQCS